jgi:hypothetical protein
VSDLPFIKPCPGSVLYVEFGCGDDANDGGVMDSVGYLFLSQYILLSMETCVNMRKKYEE